VVVVAELTQAVLPGWLADLADLASSSCAIPMPIQQHFLAV
jgi:hypothetical protein